MVYFLCENLLSLKERLVCKDIVPFVDLDQMPNFVEQAPHSRRVWQDDRLSDSPEP